MATTARRAARAMTTCPVPDEPAPLTDKGKPKSALRLKGERAFGFVKGIVEYLTDRDWSLYSAGLGFYALVSLTPFVLLAVALGGVVFGGELAKAELSLAVTREAGPQVAAMVVGFAEGAADVLSLSIASVFGVLLLLWSSTNLFTQVRNALHVAWALKTPEPKKSSFWKSVLEFLRRRMFAAFGTLVFGALFIALLGTRVALTAIESKTSDFLEMPFWVWDIADLVVAVTFMTLLVRAIYRLIPDHSPTGLAPWIGAASTAVLVVLGRTGVAIYLSVGSVDSAFGAAGTLVVFLGWAYWSAYVFLFGARLTHTLACRWDSWPAYEDDRTPAEKQPGAKMLDDKKDKLAQQKAEMPAAAKG